MRRLTIRGAPPLDNEAVDIYRVFIPRSSVENGKSILTLSGTFSGTSPVSGTFTNIADTTETTAGRTLAITFDSSNFSSAQVTITGVAGGSPQVDTKTFLNTGTLFSSFFWTSITQIAIVATGANTTLPAGAIMIMEQYPINVAQNGGTAKEVAQYANGEFLINIANTNTEWTPPNGFYHIDYPMPINIPMGYKKNLVIGADIKTENNWDGIIESPIFRNSTLSDVRPGETDLSVTATSLNGRVEIPLPDQNTTIQLDLHDRIRDITPIKFSFDKTCRTTTDSVNPQFGSALALDDAPYVLRNAHEYIGSKRGTIEFFISPLLDTDNNFKEDKYIFDAASFKNITLRASTRNTIILPERVKKVNKVFLAGDDTRTPYSFRLQPDGRTLTLRSQLPAHNSTVVVDAIPIDAEGNRMSLYVDGYGGLHYSVETTHGKLEIFRNIDWHRNTWHRVMASWDINPANNMAAIRMFVDGDEDNSAVWGQDGLIWGAGLLWGTSQTVGGNRTVAGTGAELEVFHNITFGAAYDGSGTFPIKIDNLRFSAIPREPVKVGSSYYDMVWNDNVSQIQPVTTDTYTKGLFDFDQSSQETAELTNALYAASPLFTVGVEIDDGFGKVVDDQTSKDLLTTLYRKVRPAHLKFFSKYKQDET